VWAGRARDRLGTPGKLAFLMVDFLQVEDTLRKRAVVLMEVAQSHLEGLEDNPQVLKDICLAVRLSLQRSLPGWMPAMTANKARDRKVYKRLSFSNSLTTIQRPSPPTRTGSSASVEEPCSNHVLPASKMEKSSIQLTLALL